MADAGQSARTRARGGLARGRARPAGWRGRDSRRSCAPPAQRIGDWVAADVAPGRLVPWLADRIRSRDRPLFRGRSRASPLGGGRRCSASRCRAAFLRAHRPIALPVIDRLAAASRRLSTATWKTARIAHPVLTAPAWNVDVVGLRRERARSASAPTASSCASTRMTGARLDEKLERVRRFGAQGHGARGRQPSSS